MRVIKNTLRGFAAAPSRSSSQYKSVKFDDMRVKFDTLQEGEW
jgi:hypothetical protein